MVTFSTRPGYRPTAKAHVKLFKHFPRSYVVLFWAYSKHPELG
jgi:hypothetical protein